MLTDFAISQNQTSEVLSTIKIISKGIKLMGNWILITKIIFNKVLPSKMQNFRFSFLD